MITRRALVLTVAAIAQHGQRPALAAEGPPVAAAAAEFPLVTSRASLMITIGNKPPQEMLVGLYGDTSPSSVALFKGLCAGTLPSVEFQSTLSYAGSTASRIEKDRVIVLGKLGAGTAQYIERSIDGTGYVRSELVNRADSFIDWQGAVDTDYVEALRALRLAYKLPLDMMRSLATHFKSEAVAGLAGQPSSVCHIGLEPPRTSRAQAGMLLTRARLVWGRCVCCPPL